MTDSSSASSDTSLLMERKSLESKDIRFAGFWIRVVAYIIDGIVLNVPLYVIYANFIYGMFFYNASSILSLSTSDHSLDIKSPLMNSFGLIYFITFVMPIIFDWLYHALMESSSKSATLGKLAFGLKVVTDNGERLTFANATGRYFAKYVSAFILGIGFLMVAFQREKRGLHDFMAGTVVATSRSLKQSGM